MHYSDDYDGERGFPVGRAKKCRAKPEAKAKDRAHLAWCSQGIDPFHCGSTWSTKADGLETALSTSGSATYPHSLRRISAFSFLHGDGFAKVSLSTFTKAQQRGKNAICLLWVSPLLFSQQKNHGALEGYITRHRSGKSERILENLASNSLILLIVNQKLRRSRHTRGQETE